MAVGRCQGLHSPRGSLVWLVQIGSLIKWTPYVIDMRDFYGVIIKLEGGIVVIHWNDGEVSSLREKSFWQAVMDGRCEVLCE